MKKFFLLFPLLFLACSSQTDMGKALEGYVSDGYATSDIDYKLISYEVIDTITNGEMIDSLRALVINDIFCLDGITKEMFMDSCTISYPTLLDQFEIDRIKGKEKDRDMYAAKWDKISPYNMDANYTYLWFRSKDNESKFLNGWRNMSSFDLDRSGAHEGALCDILVENKAVYDLADSLYFHSPDSVYMYRINHTYSIIEPVIGERITYNDEVGLDCNMRMIFLHNKDDFNNMMRQLSE